MQTRDEGRVGVVDGEGHRAGPYLIGVNINVGIRDLDDVAHFGRAPDFPFSSNHDSAIGSYAERGLTSAEAAHFRQGVDGKQPPTDLDDGEHEAEKDRANEREFDGDDAFLWFHRNIRWVTVMGLLSVQVPNT